MQVSGLWVWAMGFPYTECKCVRSIKTRLWEAGPDRQGEGEKGRLHAKIFTLLHLHSNPPWVAPVLGTTSHLRANGQRGVEGQERRVCELSRKQLGPESQPGSATSLGEEKGAGPLTRSSLRLERPGQTYSVDTRQR